MYKLVYQQFSDNPYAQEKFFDSLFEAKKVGAFLYNKDKENNIDSTCIIYKDRQVVWAVGK